MRLSEIDKKAKNLGIKETWRYSKKELVRSIQRKEGYSPCFSAANNNCNELACCWRDDCLR